MKFRISQWHHWFAWRPVQINDGSWVWLKFILRRSFDGNWEYGLPEEPGNFSQYSRSYEPTNELKYMYQAYLDNEFKRASEQHDNKISH
jgi:hypothetical protein